MSKSSGLLNREPHKLASWSQSPQLAIQIVGPREVMYGSKAKYQIHITNPGNGVAENVTLHVSSGDGVQSKQFGQLAAAGRETVELELLAREAGELMIEAAAIADGDLQAESQLPVRIRRAQLEMTLTGPTERYAGQDAIYNLTVSNVGDAPATNLLAQITLPQGAEYLGGINAANVNNGRLQFPLPDMAPQAKQQYRFQITLPVPGQQRVMAQAASNSELMASAAAATNVVAIADLKLAIDDPRGPVPTGQDVVYEVTVINRGSRAAENVTVLAQFSNGIEPISYQGHNARIAADGQVIFDPIPSLGGGQTMVLKVTARADQPGTHRFRATVRSADAEVQHIAEETTKYFARLGGPDASAPNTNVNSTVPGAVAEPPAYQSVDQNAIRSPAPMRSAEAPASTPIGAGTATDPIDLTPTPLETAPLSQPQPFGAP